MDLVTPEEVARIKHAVKVLNPSAVVATTEHSRVTLDKVVKTGLFKMEVAEKSAGWLKSLQGEMVPETEEYGISSFIYRARRVLRL
jgi:G3E family GTPase